MTTMTSLIEAHLNESLGACVSCRPLNICVLASPVMSRLFLSLHSLRLRANI